jgi:hypothetical protein
MAAASGYEPSIGKLVVAFDADIVPRNLDAV